MLAYNTDILKILERRVNLDKLEGYFGGAFSPDGTKFIACTYLRLDANEPNLYYGAGHSSINIDSKKTLIDIGNGCYQAKPLDQCIREGVYTARVYRFAAMLYEEEWFVRDELIFFGDEMNEDEVKAFLGRYLNYENFWQTGDFTEDWHVKVPGTDQRIRDISMEEFPAASLLVRHIKIERKEHINHTYAAYMNALHVQPFFRQLRIDGFEEFSEFIALYSETDHCLIFPESKVYFLVVSLVKHLTLGYRRVWFFFDAVTEKFYRWIYPEPKYTQWSYHYAVEVIEDIKEVSGWDDYGFLHSSRTLDNDGFWAEYVLKKENGKYRWLQEIY